MYSPGLDSCSLVSADLWNISKANDNTKPKLHLSLGGFNKLVLVKLYSSSVQ